MTEKWRKTCLEPYCHTQQPAYFFVVAKVYSNFFQVPSENVLFAQAGRAPENLQYN